MNTGKSHDDNRARARDDGASGGFTLSPDPIVSSEQFAGAKSSARSAPGRHAPAYEDLGELPATYHEDLLFLIARDPRTLFAYWDFDWTKVPASAFRFAVPVFHLRAVRSDGSEEAVVQIQPAVRNWTLAVSTPGAEYTAELGHYAADGRWVACARSRPAKTPPESAADANLPVQFATMPAAMSFERMRAALQQHMAPGESLLHAVARITGDARALALAGEASTWTDEQRRMVAALLGQSLVERMSPGAREIDQTLRDQLTDLLARESARGSAPSPARFDGMGSSWPSSWASGAGWSGSMHAAGSPSWPGHFAGSPSWPREASAPAGFSMHLNAEVIFYGGTHPDATVYIDGKQIELHPDGTFRYHFRLPDGDWAIPIVAHSADDAQRRSATLTLSRSTSCVGEVAATPQPAELPLEPMARK